MSEQILLQGKILGIQEFLLSPTCAASARVANEECFLGRCVWVSLLCEVLPRALLAELKLARILLGSAGGGQFLLVLPGEARSASEEFLARAGEEIAGLSNGTLRLVCGITENLGDWTVVRKRLNEDLLRQRGTPLASLGAGTNGPQAVSGDREARDQIIQELGATVRDAETVGWSPESPGRVLLNGGKHVWKLTPNLTIDGITMARHGAPSDSGRHRASLGTLAHRSSGRKMWGILRGDVDNLGVRLRRVQSIEEHVQLSVLYKHFFAGELEVLCSMPEFWRKVSILYSGGDDFAVCGSWDALIQLSREIQRLFHRFVEENLKDFPGAEGKTITMALAVASDQGSSPERVFEEAGRNLEFAKNADKDCIYLLGRILEWRQLSDASELKDTVTRMVAESRSSRQILFDLGSFYGKLSSIGRSPSLSPGGAEIHVEKIWRFHRRFNRVLGGARDRDTQKLRAHLISEIAARNAAQVKLRPAGQVALEWARLLTEV